MEPMLDILGNTNEIPGLNQKGHLLPPRQNKSEYPFPIQDIADFVVFMKMDLLKLGQKVIQAGGFRKQNHKVPTLISQGFP